MLRRLRREKIYRDKAKHASPIGTPDVFQIIWSSRYLTADEATRRQEALPYETIRLERTPCYGTCPVYSVAFHKDGSAELNAEANMPQLGRFPGNIRITEFARMCYALERFGYQQLKSEYTAPWTDDATCIVTVKGKETKVVSEYGQVGPIELWAIQMIIDQVRQGVDWKPALKGRSKSEQPTQRTGS